MKSKKKIIELINEMDDGQLVTLNNEYCRSAGYTDDEIYMNGAEFFEMHFGNKVIDAISAIDYGSYHPSYDYVRYTGYGTVQSLEYFTTDDLVDTPDKIADDIRENPKNYSNF